VFIRVNFARMKTQNMIRRDRHAVNSPKGKLRAREGEGRCVGGCGVLHFTLARDSSFHCCKTAATQATPDSYSRSGQKVFPCLRGNLNLFCDQNISVFPQVQPGISGCLGPGFVLSLFITTVPIEKLFCLVVCLQLRQSPEIQNETTTLQV
jgi:hypothetical protein